MACRENNELQLLEVSRGVRKLTQMIDSWAKSPNLDARSKYIAKDLLRGSLNLQESLITIGRIQEASRIMSMMEQKRQVEEDVNVGKRSNSERFGASIYDDILQCLSTNGSSVNHANEIKSVVRGKLNRQSHDDDNASPSWSMDSSTTSSSSLAYNSTWVMNRAKEAKTPNLIAKLMGLDKVPSQIVQPMRKEVENNNGIAMLRRSISIEDSRIGSTPSFGAKIPPIVIINPLHISPGKMGEIQKQKEKLSTRLLPKKKTCDHGNGKVISTKGEVKKLEKTVMESSGKIRVSACESRKLKKQKPMAMGLKECLQSDSLSNYIRDMEHVSSPLQAKRISESTANPDKSSTTSKCKAHTMKVQATRKRIAVNDVKTISKHSAMSLMEERKGEKEAKRSNKMKISSENFGVGRKIATTNMPRDLSISRSTSYIHVFPKQLTEDPKLCFRENLGMPLNSFQKLKNGKCCKDSISVDGVKGERQSENEANLLLVLQTEAEQFFGFDAEIHERIFHERNDFHELERRGDNNELILGFARELMARKRCQLELFYHPFWRSYKWSWKAFKSVEQLVEDVSVGIKKLNGDYRVVNSVDDVFFKLEEDLGSKGMFLNAIWDVGWMNWVCVEEVDILVGQVEELVICGLVGELFC